VKQCEWDEKTITVAALIGNLEMLKYCFSNDCPYDEEASCKLAAKGGHLDCVRFLFDQVEPSRETEKEVAIQAVGYVRINILKYLVEERKIPEIVKVSCVTNAAAYGGLESLKYLVEEAKVVTSSIPSAKTTSSKKGVQNHRTKNTPNGRQRCCEEKKNNG
jgi:hypothetical protein